MKKSLSIVLCIVGFAICNVAFAAGDKITTSKTYVDAQIATKQEKISAVNSDTVITTTNTDGAIGQKAIYDATQNYASQTDALVTAADANAAVQNAIDTEFVCIEWGENAEPTDENCYIWEIRAAKLASLPSGYTALEYLESTGTQYIDTGVTPTNNTGILIDFQYTNPDTVEQIIIGSFDPNFLVDRYSDKLAYAYRARQGVEESFQLSADTIMKRYTVEMNWKNNAKFKFDNIVRNLSNIVFSNSLPMYIFSCNGLPSRIVKKGRVYSLKISNNTEVIRDFIAARRDSDGVLGMYDLVTGVFLTNSGTGTFIAGPKLNTYLPSGN